MKANTYSPLHDSQSKRLNLQFFGQQTPSALIKRRIVLQVQEYTVTIATSLGQPMIYPVNTVMGWDRCCLMVIDVIDTHPKAPINKTYLDFVKRHQTTVLAQDIHQLNRSILVGDLILPTEAYTTIGTLSHLYTRSRNIDDTLILEKTTLTTLQKLSPQCLKSTIGRIHLQWSTLSRHYHQQCLSLAIVIFNIIESIEQGRRIRYLRSHICKLNTPVTYLLGYQL